MSDQEKVLEQNAKKDGSGEQGMRMNPGEIQQGGGGRRQAAQITRAAGVEPVILRTIRDNFEYFALLSLAYGVLYTFCMYRNPSGITYPFFVAGAYVISVFMLRKLEIPIKRLSFFIMAISVLLGVSSCRTDSYAILIFNKFALLLLGCVFVIHQFYEESSWNIGKYVSSIAWFLCCALGCIQYPFQHGICFLKNMLNKRYRKLALVCSGIAIAIPVVVLAVVLLCQADVVFESIIGDMMDSIFQGWTIPGILFKTVLGMMTIYCFLCSAGLKNISDELVDRRKWEPLIGAICVGSVAVVYLFFCAVQIVYLFLGQGQLPDDLTYSEYARKGFFQLVFIVLMNLAMVLCMIKYFKESKGLNIVLTIICGCTYVMTASAIYRMLLYIGSYHLTFLRVFVLWFLLLIAGLMAGVVVLIYRNEFPLFRYSLVMVSVFYLGFAWMKPDLFIARYNYDHMEAWNGEDVRYIIHLSSDAATVVAELEELPYVSGEGEGYIYSGKRYYDTILSRYNERRSFRTYNFSLEKARKLFQEYEK